MVKIDHCKRCGPEGCIGPCFDLCMCSHCWRGWSNIRFRTKLRWRIDYLWSEMKAKWL